DEAVHRRLLQELRPGPRSPAAYRRNVITRGVDLNSLIGQEFTVQGVRFLGVAESKPCYWMDQAVGVGAEKFLRGNGGLRAKILSDGIVRVDCATEAGLLLAGGRSRRMGQDKATMEWRGGALGAHQAATLAESGAWPLLLSCRAEQPWTPTGFARIEDPVSDGGVLNALINAWSATNAEVLSVLAIDLPDVKSEWLARMAGIARENVVTVVPFHAHRFDPLVAAWHRSALPALESASRDGRSLQEVCEKLMNEGRLRAFEPSRDEIDQLTNVNTPQDLIRLG
ncbi:MAG TPA: NTP transferase domain-containing protein, partial [Opitutus sp.]|nr:NTP transferase domain-containing protein [Opitutus sp.]